MDVIRLIDAYDCGGAKRRLRNEWFIDDERLDFEAFVLASQLNDIPLAAKAVRGGGWDLWDDDEDYTGMGPTNGYMLAFFLAKDRASGGRYCPHCRKAEPDRCPDILTERFLATISKQV